MPEGHKTHWIARHHSQLLAGHTLRVFSPQGRFSQDAKRVDKQTLARVVAAGKHLFYQFDNHKIVHVHLGRYGSFREQTGAPEPRGLVRMRLFDGTTTIDLNGPTQCRVIDMDTQSDIESKLGPDPLAGGDWKVVWQKVQASNKPIGAIILDQSVIAGVGNIFRAELFFETKIDPLTPGSELTKTQFQALWKSLLKMMKTGLKYGKIITVTAKEAGKSLDQLSDKERFRIYGKKFCPECGGDIQVPLIGSRKLYVCPHCQSMN